LGEVIAMNMFKTFMRKLHDSSQDVIVQPTRAALAPLDAGDANKKHIEQRTLGKIEAARLLKIAVRRMKEDRQRCEAAIEMYLDDWVFHNGPITNENIAEAMADCVDRIRQRAQAAHQVAEERAEDYGGMRDFPL
jgi:hypothetical protein